MKTHGGVIKYMYLL